MTETEIQECPEDNDTGNELVCETSDNIENQEYNEDNSFAAEIVKEMRQNEEDRMNERWKGGRVGKINKYLNTTRLGRWIKTTSKIVLGTGIAAGAISMAGPAALIGAPIAYAFGKRTVIDGVIEGIQGLAKGNRLRISLEGKKQDQILMEDGLLGLEEQFLNNEMTEEEYCDAAAELVQDIRNTESEVITNEKSNIKWESGQKLLRGIASNLGTLALGYLQGVPLGTQNFDGKAAHAVKMTRHGFDFLYNTNEAIAQTTHNVWGQAAHTMGQAIPKDGMIGLGTAMTGLFVKTASEFSSWWKNRDRDNSSNQNSFSEASDQQGEILFNGQFPDNETIDPKILDETASAQTNDVPRFQDATVDKDNTDSTNNEPGNPEPETNQDSQDDTDPEKQPGNNNPNDENTSGDSAKSEPEQKKSETKQEPSYNGKPFDFDSFHIGHGKDIDQENLDSLINNIERIMYNVSITTDKLKSYFGDIENPDLDKLRKMLVLPNVFTLKMLNSSSRKARSLCHPDKFSDDHKKNIAELLSKIINLGFVKLRETIK